MINQNAFISTAMLASLWEKEKKDTLALMVPFVKYAIGKTTSLNSKIDISSVQKCVNENFDFHNLPDSVLIGTLNRLCKSKIVRKNNRHYFLVTDICNDCQIVDIQRNKAREQTDDVVSALTEYLNQKKEALFKKDVSKEEAQRLLGDFLERNGYLIYSDIRKMSEITRNDSTYIYHIGRFILTEYDKNTIIFSNFIELVKGFMLSKVIYGYPDALSNANFIDTRIYFDTSLILHVFGYKCSEDNSAAKQLMSMLQNNKIPTKCYEHNYDEVYRIIEAYKYSLASQQTFRNGQTLEYFDSLEYSINDIDRVLLSLRDKFLESKIEVVAAPSLSTDQSCIVSKDDFSGAIGEEDLKKFLDKEMHYNNKDALDNDVKSISSIYILREGKQYDKIEQCKALFVTTNYRLVHFTKTFLSQKNCNTVPLCISDLDLTTLMWLKNNKRYADFPVLRIIEAARLSLEPTEQIRVEFAKKIEQMKQEPSVTDEMAASYRCLIHNQKEKVMDLIEGNPDKIKSLQPNDFESMSREYYSKKLSNENDELKSKFSGANRASSEDIEYRAKIIEKKYTVALKIVLYSLLISILLIGGFSIIYQLKRNDIDFFAFVLLFIGILGLADSILPKFKYLKRLITIIVNKRTSKFREKELTRFRKIFGSVEDTKAGQPPIK